MVASPDSMVHDVRRPRPGAKRPAMLCLLATACLLWSVTVTAQTSKAAVDTRLAEGERALVGGDQARAFELASAYVKAHPASARGRLLLARIHVERRDLEQAYEELDRALRSDPRNVDALALMGFVAGELAAVAFGRLETEAPDSARAHQLQAEALEAQDRRADAETAYEAALARNPALVDVLLALAKLKRARLACDEAVGLYLRAENARPSFDGAYGLGFCLAYLQDHAAAVRQFELATTRDPSAAVAWSALGSALVRLKRTSEAIAALQRAVALEPRMAEAYYLLGTAYAAAGDTARAKAAFAKTEQLRSEGAR